MTKLSGASALLTKPIGSTVSSPGKKREIVRLGTTNTPEGPALVFFVVESFGHINMEASDEDSDKCPKGKERLVVTETHRGSEGDKRVVTEWDEFRRLKAKDYQTQMRLPNIVDANPKL